MIDFYAIINQAMEYYFNTSFNLKVLIVLLSFGLVSFLLMIIAPLSKTFKKSSKRAYIVFSILCCVGLYLVMRLEFTIYISSLISFILACVGGLVYLYLILFKAKSNSSRSQRGGDIHVQALSPPPPNAVRGEGQAVPADVRLEHAVSIIDKLLLLNVSRVDRGTLNSMKATFLLYRQKGTLTAEENKVLNDSLNALLKLMSKYKV